jgi:hypothetical protein
LASCEHKKVPSAPSISFSSSRNRLFHSDTAPVKKFGRIFASHAVGGGGARFPRIRARPSPRTNVRLILDSKPRRVENNPLQPTLMTGGIMKLSLRGKQKLEEGKVGWVLLWLLGVPLPILLILFLMRGCT